jgi:antitoxin component of MazEF toxin-antitoxin module
MLSVITPYLQLRPWSWQREYIRVYTGPMKLVKIRRVGNSNVVSIPHEHESLGFTPDVPVLVTALPTGELRVLPASRLRQMIREYGRRVIAEDRAAIHILEDHDRQKD